MSRLAPKEALPSYGSVSTKALVAENAASQTLDEKASIAIFLNAIIGPGIVALPKLYQVSGWVLPSAILVVGGCLAAFATVVRCETVALMPGNAEFGRRVEFGDPVREWLGERAYYASHVGFYLASLSMSISSITTVASTTDSALAYIFGRSWAVFVFKDRGVSGPAFVFRAWGLDHCDMNEPCRPFFTGEDFQGEVLISLGYALSTVVLLPMCLSRISDSMALQYASAAVCVLSLCVFIGHGVVLAAGSDGFGEVAAVQTAQDKTGGVVVFNLMYGIFVSTWLNEKLPRVDARVVIYKAAGLSTCAFVAFATVLGAALSDMDWNALTYFTSKGTPWVVRSAALAFGWFVIASGVPVSCVMATQNLATELDERLARFLGAGVPFLISWTCTSALTFTEVVNLSGIFIVAPLALVLPLVLRLAADRPLKDEESTFAWFASHLTYVAPFDDNSPHDALPDSAYVRRRRRPIYATAILALSAWIVSLMLGVILSPLFDPKAP